MGISLKMTSLVFFLATVLLLQMVTFSPLAFAQTTNEDIQIPSWFKNNAKWWKEDRISDIEIINSIQNLFERGIIKLDTKNIQSEITESNVSTSSSTEKMTIPSYIKQVFVFWEEGSVSDTDVANSIKFLIEEKIIITQASSIPQQEEKSEAIIEQPSQSPKKEGKSAAIIDQLHEILPNESFQKLAKKYLEHAGYNVDIFTTEDITIDFYKKLPSMDYKFIIFRIHSLADMESENPTYLFTGEKYDINKYIPEQISGHVAKGFPATEEGVYEEYDESEITADMMYFLVSSKLFEEMAVGQFPKSLIIIGGCDSMKNFDLAKTFLERGAAGVLGWDRSVTAYENDRVILAILKAVLLEKTTIGDAMQSANEQFGPEMEYSSQLRYLHR